MSNVNLVTPITTLAGPAAAAPIHHEGHGAHANGDAHAAHGHDPNLAHHFETPEQQFQSGKLGMWVFLATEILMFGGLFCAYAVYRHNHPEVFAEAHKALDRTLGAINTVVLITSSLTMAWGVRCAQLNQRKALIGLLFLTLCGGMGFMCIKAIEYHTKWQHHLFIGPTNEFNALVPKNYTDKAASMLSPGGEANAHGQAAERQMSEQVPGEASHGSMAKTPEKTEAGHGEAHSAANAAAPPAPIPAVVDPNDGTGDAAKIKFTAAAPAGLSATFATGDPPKPVHEGHEIDPTKLVKLDQERLSTFFSVYFLMTGLHGLHVVIGMALIFWIMMRAAGPRQAAWLAAVAPLLVGFYFLYLGVLLGVGWVLAIGIVVTAGAGLWALTGLARSYHTKDGVGEFSSTYFTPVDLVGLYWHLVDLIWIFLFPLLYLIH